MLNAGEPLLVAHGLCGRLELYNDRIRIVRRGLINYVLYLIGGTLAELDTHIPIEKIASIDIVKPIIWNDYVTVAYPGGPPNKGETLKDATAENALFLNFFDNRAVYDIIYILERMVSEPIHVTLETDQSRAARRIRDRVSQVAGPERDGGAEGEAAR
jgi:hypothetical protein